MDTEVDTNTCYDCTVEADRGGIVVDVGENERWNCHSSKINLKTWKWCRLACVGNMKKAFSQIDGTLCHTHAHNINATNHSQFHLFFPHHNNCFERFPLIIIFIASCWAWTMTDWMDEGDEWRYILLYVYVSIIERSINGICVRHLMNEQNRMVQTTTMVSHSDNNLYGPSHRIVATCV